MILAPGTRLGSYEVAAPIGAGGMGVVYSARDTTLGRDVAIKVLPQTVGKDIDRIARFEREAKTLAAFNHPNIAQIYGVERASDGTLALAMELVDGVTLEQRLAQGALAHGEALTIAMQIADALEAAHGRGIVHRDLKPANIKLKPDGIVKVLDFGIAKAFDSGVSTVGQQQVLTTPAMTEAGIVLGTAPYMSPEQARGRPVDQRTDIWAFGCVLYEMLTGQFAFGGDDVTTVLARVLERDADMTALPATVSPAVRRTLELCLEKEAGKRIADIRDVKLALAGRFGAAEPATAHPEGVRRRAFLALAVIACGALAGLAAWTLKPAPRIDRPIVRATHLLTDNPGDINPTRAIAISPDGRRFVHNGAGGLYLRPIDTFEARIIPGTERPSFAGPSFLRPVFSPNGEWLAFWERGQIRRMPVSGGASLAIATGVSYVGGMFWSADGMIVYAEADTIWQISENGGEPLRLLSTDGGIPVNPQRLPNGDWILYTSGSLDAAGGQVEFEIVVASPSVGERRTLRSGAGTVDTRYVATGHLLVGQSGVLYAIPFDLSRLELSGGPVPVLEGVRTASPTGIHHYDVSLSGDLVYIPGPARSEAQEYLIAMVDRAGAITPIGSARGPYRHVRASPDGRRLAVDSDDGNEAIVWIYDLGDGSAMRRLTFEGRNRFPVWSPDGERLALQSDRDGGAAIYVQRIDGEGEPQRLTAPGPGEIHIPESWSPDGEHLSFSVLRENTFSLAIVSLADSTVAPFGSVRSAEPIGSVFSADGQWLAYHALPPGAVTESASAGVFIEPFPRTGARYQVPKVAIDFQPVWSRDGPELFYISATVLGQLASVQVSTGGGFSFVGPHVRPFTLMADRLSTGTRAFDALPDGRFVGLIAGTVSDTSAPQVRIVLNWFEELKRLAPTPN